MKLGLKIFLIVISLILLAVVIGIAVIVPISKRINDTSKPAKELSFWQSMIKDETPLKSVVMPGSHDAGTAGMAWVGETQSRDIGDQLRCGTRYFDLRVKMVKGELRIYHGPVNGLYFKDVLADVRDFMNENPSETLVLDVHKFGNNEAKPKTVEMLDEYIGDRLLKNDTGKDELEFMEELTLGEARGKCVLIWGDVDAYALSDSRYFLRNDDHGDRNVGCLQSFYNKNWNWYYSSEKYIEKALPAYVNMYKESIGGLFVLQGQLTDGALIAGPRFREGCHEKNMNEYVESLAYDAETLKYINIIMRDFVSPQKNAITISLNFFKGAVKEDSKDAFFNMVGISEQTIACYGE